MAFSQVFVATVEVVKISEKYFATTVVPESKSCRRGNHLPASLRANLELFSCIRSDCKSRDFSQIASKKALSNSLIWMVQHFKDTFTAISF